MDTLSLEVQDGIAILILNNGVSNTITPKMVAEMTNVLDTLAEDTSIRGLVLTSSNEKFFSIGFDIPNLYPLPREEFEKFYRAFNQLSLKLFTIPKPSIAAIIGHAIAGGCILSLCCDFRIISEGRKLIGLNEIKLGAPVPYPVDCMLRDLIGTRKARQVMEFGEFYSPEEALQLGMVDHITALEDVISASVEKIKPIAGYSPKAYAIIKNNRVKPVESQILAGAELLMNDFSDCWYSEETRKLLQEAIEKF